MQLIEKNIINEQKNAIINEHVIVNPNGIIPTIFENKINKKI